MIIWQGFGFLVILVPIIYLVALIALIFGLDKPEFIFFGTGVAMALAAFTIWDVGNRLNRVPDKVLIDPETNEEVAFKRKHTLFWIPMQWFSIPAFMLAMLAISLHFF